MKIQTFIASAFALPLAVTLQADEVRVEDPAGGVRVEEVPTATAPASAVSGSLSFDVNTHFISYGLDVWGAGNNWSDGLFNPSLELAWAVSDSTSIVLGTWWDINDNAVSDIGGRIQEIDVWTGISHDFGGWSATLLYQAWMFGGGTEQIVDLILGLDAPFSPSLTIHGRLDEGASGGDTGVVGVLGADLWSGELGAVSVGLPLAAAFATDGFHGGDGGFAYASGGISVSTPLDFIRPEFGAWDLHAGVTAYYTDNAVIPSNPDDFFVTGSIGVGVSF